MLLFSLGCSEFDRLDVSLREEISSIAVHDWLEVCVSLTLQGVNAVIPMVIVPIEVRLFREELSRVHREVGGTARFRTSEGQLSIDVVVNALGRVAASGELRCDLSGENHVRFLLSFDQTFLERTISEIDRFLFAIK